MLTERMAQANIDIAIDCLNNLLKSTPEKLGTKESKEYSRKIKQYSESIHSRVWLDLVPVERVEKEIIPLLEKAHKKIIWEGEYYKNVRIDMRYLAEHLEYRYCTGNSQCLPEWHLKEKGLPATLATAFF